MQSIVDAKGCAAPGFHSISKRHDSNGNDRRNWGGKRVHSTKAITEHWIHEDAVEFPDAATQEELLKYESKMKCDLKEEVKDERKAMRVPKKEVKKDLMLSKVNAFSKSKKIVDNSEE